METTNVFDYIKSEEQNWKTVRIPLTSSKDWNMREHIERCTNVSNGWFHQGRNDGLRPYNDVVTPIINVSFRLEGFDVKHIVPFVDSVGDYYKSFLVAKYHPRWARKYKLDTFIDEVVETSIIYDLVLVKDVNEVRPEVIDLKTIAFCDQTDIMAGPICIKHQMTVADLLEYKGKWDDDAINMAILMAKEEKSNNLVDGQTAKTPSKYIEVYELVGNLPETWIKETGEMYKYVPQKHIVCFYKSKDGEANGITLFKGKDKPLHKTFKALKIDGVRSKGRACGRSIVETLFESQVWANYDAIKIKSILDSAFNLVITDSLELGNQKLTELKPNTILKQNKGDNTQLISSNLNNITAFQNHQMKLEQDARVMGSASDPALGINPVSGTPLGTTQTIVQEGQGIHEYRQGKIATFFADVLYPELILEYLVKEMNNGLTFSEELTLEEIQEVAKKMAQNEYENTLVDRIIATGKVPTDEERAMEVEARAVAISSGGNRRFLEVVKDELKDIPVSVYMNIKGKQRQMAQNADKLSNMVRDIIQNAERIKQIPGIGKVYNELLEESGMSPIDFTQITGETLAQPQQPAPQVSAA